MEDRKSDNPLEEASKTPETKVIRIRVSDLPYPDERPIELCAKLEEYRAWMERSAHRYSLSAYYQAA